MMYLRLFWEFFKIGIFAFGGAYGAVPLIRESVETQGWMTGTAFTNMVALSESTPGPIMVNAATYIGATQAGVWGAMAATLGVILPSFILILLITAFWQKWLRHRKVQAILKGIKPCLIGVIFATGLYMAFAAMFTFGAGEAPVFQVKAFVILLLLAGVTVVYKKVRKEELSPILLIMISAAVGMMM